MTRFDLPAADSKGIDVLALVKGEERYVFMFDAANRREAIRTMGRFASDPLLSFTWHDVATLSRKIREMS